MEIKIKEVCLTEDENGKRFEGVRTLVYITKSTDIREALNDYEDNFNVDNIISCNDDFDGECLEILNIISVEIR